MNLKQLSRTIISKCISKPKITIIFFLILSLFSIFVSLKKMEINTSTEGLISEKANFKKKQFQLRENFPIISENIVVVINSNSFETLNDVTKSILEKFEEILDELDFIYSPNFDNFFKNNFFYLINEKKQNEILEELYSSQPFISTINSNPKLEGLNNLIELFLKKETKKIKEKEIKVINQILSSFKMAITTGNSVNWKESLDQNPKQNFIIFKINKDFVKKNGLSEYYNFLLSLKVFESSNIKINFTGSTILDFEEANSVVEGASLAGVLSLFFVFFLLFLAFQNFLIVFCLILTIVVGLVITLGLTSIFVGSLNIISVAFAVLFIGISVDFGIQISFRLIENLRKQSKDNILKSINEISSSLLIVTCTSLIGFLSFVPTEYIGLSELGIISSIGLVVGLITNLIFLSSCLSLLKLKKNQKVLNINFLRILNLILNFKKTFFFSFLIIMILGILSVKEINFDSDPFKLKDQKSQSVLLAKSLMEKNPSSDNFISIYKNNFDNNDINFLQDNQLIKTFFSINNVQLSENIKEQISYLRYLYSQKNDVFYSNYHEIERFKNNLKEITLKRPSTSLISNELLSQIDNLDFSDRDMFTYVQDLWFGNFNNLIIEISAILNLKEFDSEKVPLFFKQRYISKNNIERIEVYPEKDISKKINLIEFVDSIESRFSKSIGMPIIQIEAGKIVIESFLFAFSISFLFLFFFSFVIFKNFFHSVFCILPLIFSAIFISLLMRILDLDLNFANMISLPLLFSLGTSYSIYIIKRVIDLGSVDKMLQSTTPFAVLFSGLTTIASFGTLSFSNHAGTSSMGIVLFISLSTALFFCTIILPFLLKYFKLTI